MESPAREGVGDMTKLKLILCGIDGATWKVIRPMMDQGKLPDFEHLVQSGSSGSLRSFNPSYSPIIWTTIATGKMPDKHGVKKAFPTRHDIKTLTIWDILEDQGERIGVFNWHVTWPPRPVNGFMVPGGWGGMLKFEDAFPQELGFILKMRKVGQDNTLTYIELYKIFEKALRHGMSIRSLMKVLSYYIKRRYLEEEILDAERSLMGQSLFGDIYMKLLQKFRPSFSAVIFDTVDSVAHATWKYYEPNKFKGADYKKAKKNRRFVPDSYRYIDRFLGRILDFIDDNTIIIIVSDHGTRSATNGGTTFDINSDLLFEKLNVKKIVDYFSINHKVYFSFVEKDVNHAEVNKYFSKLNNITIKEAGEKKQIFNVSRTDISGLYSLECRNFDVGECRDALIDLGNAYVNFSELIRINDTRVSGIHDETGVFIAYGPNIKQGYDAGNLKPTDIVPTILYSLGFPLGKDIDGQAKTHIFDEKFVAKNRIRRIETYDTKERINRYLIQKKVEEVYTPDEKEEIKRRLGKLGYF